MPPRFSDKTVVLAGDIAYFRCVMTSPNDDETYGLVNEIANQIQDRIDGLSRDILGPEFEVRRVRVVRGSVTLIFAIGTAYYVVSRYKNFVESLELFKKQLAGVMRRIMGPREVEIHVEWVPGPALATAEETIIPLSTLVERTNMILLLYLIVSHSALLGMVLWILYRRLFS